MRILNVYPRAWRARYGEELAVLIDELAGGARMSWRDRLDVVRAALVERAHALGMGGLPPRERAREGSLRVLYAWMLFVVGGFGVEKASEHWQAVTPAAKQGLPASAFDVLFVSAGVGSVLVMLGVATSLPPLLALLRGGGWGTVRRPILCAISLSVLLVAATVGLAAWAHSLKPAARNGGDALYSGVFLAWVMLFLAVLFAWAAAAAATARRLALPAPTLRLEVWLAAAVSVAMAVMTIATAIWWLSLASAAPWFFDGRPAGSAASALQLNIVLPALLMLCATLLGLSGARRATAALPSISARS